VYPLVQVETWELRRLAGGAMMIELAAAAPGTDEAVAIPRDRVLALSASGAV
jgi:hypothetical protein